MKAGEPLASTSSGSSRRGLTGARAPPRAGAESERRSYPSEGEDRRSGLAGRPRHVRLGSLADQVEAVVGGDVAPGHQPRGVLDHGADVGAVGRILLLQGRWANGTSWPAMKQNERPSTCHTRCSRDVEVGRAQAALTLPTVEQPAPPEPGSGRRAAGDPLAHPEVEVAQHRVEEDATREAAAWTLVPQHGGTARPALTMSAEVAE